MCISPCERSESIDPGGKIVFFCLSGQLIYLLDVIKEYSSISSICSIPLFFWVNQLKAVTPQTSTQSGHGGGGMNPAPLEDLKAITSLPLAECCPPFSMRDFLKNKMHYNNLGQPSPWQE